MIKTQDQIADFIQKCKTNALSVTPQRLAIYKALLIDKSHPNPECVYNSIKPDFPTISLATVYKTLETFEKHRIISVVTPLHETVRYDAEIEHHHHAVCVKCKKVMDIKDPELEKIDIPDIVKVGNQVLDYDIQFNVICDSCRAN
ncbi:MAG: transcriptional repressor [Ignavibacteriae bacterium]|nr:transcriptional repressor [Ignavibacteriota bacterium]